MQEALEKMQRTCRLPLEWHLIGPLQSNKTRIAAERFAWVQTRRPRKNCAAPVRAAPGGAAAAQRADPGERFGRSQQERRRAAQDVTALAGAIARTAAPAPARPDGDPRATGRAARALSGSEDAVRKTEARRFGLDTLSMGMSDDMELGDCRGRDHGARRHRDLRPARESEERGVTRARAMKIAFIGGGNMANALIGGLLAKGFDAARHLGDRGERRRRASASPRAPGPREHCARCRDRRRRRAGARRQAPGHEARRSPRSAARRGGKLVISIAAGMRIASLSRWLGGHAGSCAACPIRRR